MRGRPRARRRDLPRAELVMEVEAGARQRLHRSPPRCPVCRPRRTNWAPSDVAFIWTATTPSSLWNFHSPVALDGAPHTWTRSPVWSGERAWTRSRISTPPRASASGTPWHMRHRTTTRTTSPTPWASARNRSRTRLDGERRGLRRRWPTRATRCAMTCSTRSSWRRLARGTGYPRSAGRSSPRLMGRRIGYTN